MADGKYVLRGGQPKIVTIADFAGNAASDTSPGLGKVWVIDTIELKIVAVGAANRHFFVSIQSAVPARHIRLPENATAITAGQTAYWAWVKSFGGALLSNEAYDLVAYMGGDLELWGTEEFHIEITAGLAADTVSGVMRVREYALINVA